MYCIALDFLVLDYIELCHMIFHSIAWFRLVLHNIVCYCIASCGSAQRAERPRRGLSALWASRRASAQAVTSKWHFRTTSPTNMNSSAGEKGPFLPEMPLLGPSEVLGGPRGTKFFSNFEGGRKPEEVKMICLTFPSVYFQMSSQIACTRGCIATVVAFVSLFSTVCFYMFP